MARRRRGGAGGSGGGSKAGVEKLFEGDIIPDYESILKDYGPEVVQELQAKGLLVKGQNKTISTRQADVNRRWAARVNGVVYIPYAISSNFSLIDIATIQNALTDLGNRSKVVKFVRRKKELDYITVVNGDGCSSFVGRQGGKQLLSLGNGCLDRGRIQHEFLHALGFNHEQSRPDRDKFVKINFENIDPSMAYNFNKALGTDSLGSPYDYGSVMHYGKTDFSKNGLDTITAPKPIGQLWGADTEDIAQVILLYQCVSGARSLSKYNARPCNNDCKCWKGATGCNGDNNACLPGLVCWANKCATANIRTFRSFHGNFLSAFPDNSVQLMQKEKADTWEKFLVEDAGNGKIFLRSFHGTYLSAWTENNVKLIDHANEWEQWTIVPNSDVIGGISLLSFHGTYLSAYDDGSVRLENHNFAWEHWF